MASVGEVSGTVSEVRTHLHVSGGGRSGSGSSSPVSTWETLSFLVSGTGVTPPRQGRRSKGLPPGTVVVDWRPRGIPSTSIRHAPIADGDRVRVTGTWRQGGLSARVIENHTRGATVEGAVTSVRKALVGLAVGSALVAGGVTFAVSHDTTGRPASGHPVSGHPVSGHPASAGEQAGSIEIPRVAGLSNVAAAAALSGAGLFPMGESAASPTVPFGEVIGTKPAAGTRVVGQATVTFEVSCGVASSTCP